MISNWNNVSMLLYCVSDKVSGTFNGMLLLNSVTLNVLKLTQTHSKQKMYNATEHSKCLNSELYSTYMLYAKI